MIPVLAPAGFDAVRCYVDRSGWHVYVKPSGDTFSTDLGYVGHADVPEADLDARAVARVQQFVERGF